MQELQPTSRDAISSLGVRRIEGEACPKAALHICRIEDTHDRPLTVLEITRRWGHHRRRLREVDAEDISDAELDQDREGVKGTTDDKTVSRVTSRRVQSTPQACRTLIRTGEFDTHNHTHVTGTLGL